MRVVLDASVLAECVRPEGTAARRWLLDLLDGDDAHIVHGLTVLEVSSAIRGLVLRNEASADWAEHMHRSLSALPVVRESVTHPMLVRIWELHNNLTPYDAAYVALTERLQAEYGGQCVLATADARLANSSAVVCPTELLIY